MQNAGNTSIQVSNVITWIISLLALFIASLSLYLQRRDRRPRLKLRIERNQQNLPTGELSDYGTSATAESEALEIYAGNPTDRTITIDKITFHRKGFEALIVPVARTISTIPPHEKRHAIVVVSRLSAQLENHNHGRFVLLDALGYEHKTKPITV